MAQQADNLNGFLNDKYMRKIIGEYIPSPEAVILGIGLAKALTTTDDQESSQKAKLVAKEASKLTIGLLSCQVLGPVMGPLGCVPGYLAAPYIFDYYVTDERAKEATTNVRKMAGDIYNKIGLSAKY